MAWFFLFVAIIGDVVWAITLKSTQGFTQLWPSVFNLSVAMLNIWFLAIAFKTLPTTLAYIVFVGGSTVAIVICAFVFQGEQITAAKLLCITMILAGIIGLKLVSQF